METVERLEVPPNPPFQARALAVRLEASALLERDTPALIREAEALLAANTVPLLEALELYRAMSRAARPVQARKYRQAAAERCRKIAAGLEGFPEFRVGFLRRYGPEG